MTEKELQPVINPVRRPHIQKLWVPIVILVGLIAGELISVSIVPSPPRYGGGPFGYFHKFPTSALFEYHVILTTVEVALLVALVVIYSRMYIETKANFALGLVVVLVALLLQALFSYPITQGLFEIVGPPDYSSFAADVVTVCAYAVFLYLSLE